MATVKASYNVISSEEGEEVGRSTVSCSFQVLTDFCREGKGCKLASASFIVASLSINFGELLVRLVE
jgi:hypothetical protein